MFGPVSDQIDQIDQIRLVLAWRLQKSSHAVARKVQELRALSDSQRQSHTMSANAQAEEKPAIAQSVKGMRVNGTHLSLLPLNLIEPPLTLLPAGKQWHPNKSAFRPRANQKSYAKRAEDRKALSAIKAKEKEMKDEKEAERQVRKEM